MIYSIRGKFVDVLDTSVLVEDASGVCWEMEVSQQTIRDLNIAKGSEVRLFGYLYHREDSMRLYGFSRLEEKQLFLLLIKVNGIGPLQSLRILSSADVSLLASAISREDENYLQSIQGIGAKGAKKIILALKDSVAGLAGAGRGAVGSGSGAYGEGAGTAAQPRFAQLIQALCDMGYERKAAIKALSEAMSSGAGDGSAGGNAGKGSADRGANSGRGAAGASEAEEGEILRRAIILLS